MAAITVQEINAPFASISAGGADFVWTAGNTGGDTFVCTGRELLLFRNDGGSTYTVTITSQTDEKGRTGNISTYSMADGDFAVFGVGLTNSKGWKDTGGLVNFAVSNAAVDVAVLRLPAGYPN